MMEDLIPIFRVEYFLDSIVNGTPNPYAPGSRLELYLARIAGADVDIPIPPQSRLELYLARISGTDMATKIPYPQSRLELYLARIAGENVEIPCPQSRIDFWLEAWAQKIAGEI